MILHDVFYSLSNETNKTHQLAGRGDTNLRFPDTGFKPPDTAGGAALGMSWPAELSPPLSVLGISLAASDRTALVRRLGVRSVVV